MAYIYRVVSPRPLINFDTFCFELSELKTIFLNVEKTAFSSKHQIKQATSIASKREVTAVSKHQRMIPMRERFSHFIESG